jgi:hypothetical protein
MSDLSRLGNRTTEEELPAEFVELARAMALLPESLRASLEPVYAKVVDNVRRRRQILMMAQEALGQLRLDVKYLMFDLEATRREREELRRKLEESQGETGQI